MELELHVEKKELARVGAEPMVAEEGAERDGAGNEVGDGGGKIVEGEIGVILRRRRRGEVMGWVDRGRRKGERGSGDGWGKPRWSTRRRGGGG